MRKNFDIDMNGYTLNVLCRKKVCVFKRLCQTLGEWEKYGGIYFDTDVEVIRSLEELLRNDAFFALKISNM